MSDFFDEQLPPELHQVARRLRADRPQASDGSIDQTKLRLRQNRGAFVGTRKVTAALVAGAMLLMATAAGAQLSGDDLFVFGSTNNTANQGLNNAQTAALILGAGTGTSICNASSCSPSVTQGAFNANVNFSSAAPVSTTGDTFLLGSSNTTVNQGINNSQTAVVGFGNGSGTFICNNSNCSPSITQGATNININGAPGSVYGTPIFIGGGFFF